MLIGYDQAYAGYFRASEQFIGEVNRLIRFNSHEYYVTGDGRTNNSWFERRDLPQDAWENTEEGKEIIALAEKYKKMQEQYEASKQAQNAEDRAAKAGPERF